MESSRKQPQASDCKFNTEEDGDNEAQGYDL